MVIIIIVIVVKSTFDSLLGHPYLVFITSFKIIAISMMTKKGNYRYPMV